MKVSVDRDRCVGAGMCMLTAEHVFGQDDDGLVEVRGPVEPGGEAAAREAEWLCPSGAVHIVET